MTENRVGSARFRLTVDDEVAIVQASGELDMATETAFEEHLRAASARRQIVIVDASTVAFADCSTLGVLAALGTDITARGRHWCVVASPFLARLLALAQLPIPTTTSLECARAHATSTR